MENPPTKRRSWLVPRFSLRALLLAFTAFAIGFPIWYRWPYEKAEIITAPGSPMRGIRTTTWQRQWGGGVLIHGAETRTIDGKLFSLTTYRNGKKNGPCVKHSLIETSNRRLVPTADPTTNGQYVEDEKDGVWTETFNGQKTVTTWHNGKQVAP